MPRWPADRLDPQAYPGPGIDLPVFYNDLDPNGHLNNVALGRFFEHARVAGVAAGGTRAVMRESGGHFLVARVAVDYVSEGQFGADLHVRTRLARLGSSSLTIEQAAWQRGGCVGLAEVVLVHLREGAPAPLPPAAAAAFGAPTG